MHSSLGLNSAVAFIDQAVLSATNFLVAFILIKTVPKNQYGYYSIVFAISLFLVSIQNALVTTPLAVLLAAKTAERKPGYIAALYWGQLLVVIPAAVLGLFVTGVFYLYLPDTIEVWTMGAFWLAALGVLLREFTRAFYFAQESPLTVLKLDSIYTFIYIGLIVAAFAFFEISVPLVLVFMGASGLLSTLLCAYRGWSFDWAAVRETYKEHWTFGRWSLLGILVTHIQSYCNLYLIGTLFSSAAAGTFSASRLPMTPLALLQTGWGKIAIPRGSRMRETGQLRQFIKEQILVSVIIGIAILAYIALLLMSAGILKKFLFNKGYESSLDFIVFWGVINIVSYAGLNASCGLQVLKEFSVIAKVNTATMIVTLASTYVLIRQYGIIGGLTSSLLGETLLALALWWCLLRRYFWRTTLASVDTNPRTFRSTLLYPRKGFPL